MILFFISQQKKGMKGSEREKLFLVMVIFFKNIRECIVLRRSLVTIHALRVTETESLLIFVIFKCNILHHKTR